MLTNISHKKGYIILLECALRFTELGLLVSLPIGPFRYDLLVDNGRQIFRIQCKTASKQSNGSYCVSTCTTVANTKTRHKTYYTSDDIDFIVTVICDELVVIPVEEVKKSSSKIFRTEPPSQGNKSKVNLIEDYTAQKYLL